MAYKHIVLRVDQSLGCSQLPDRGLFPSGGDLKEGLGGVLMSGYCS